MSETDVTDFYSIKCDPIVIRDPGEKMEYLRRGAGLRHFNLTPDFYRRPPPKLNVIRQPVKKQNLPAKRPAVKTFPQKSFPERKYALNAMKNFDDEVIPALRQKNDVLPNELKIPKTPVKKLVMRPERDYCPPVDSSEEEEEEVGRISESQAGPKREEDGRNRGAEKEFEDIGVVNEQRTSRQIAAAMKRKGLTDNVKKHLGWNPTPRKRTFIRTVKIKKPIPREKKCTWHELKEKLKLLEEEKTKIQTEFYRLKRLEKDYIDEKLKYTKMKKNLEKEIQTERDALEEERNKIIDEQKKIKRERALHEKWIQETRNLPKKNDRHEIEKLKSEINDLKEQQKVKDARTGACVAQLRNRVAALEIENTRLREDLEVAKRAPPKKVRFDPSGKIINVINKRIDAKLRPGTAPEVGSVAAKPLRRTKSSVELKVSEKPRRRGVSAGGLGDAHGVPEILDLVGSEEPGGMEKDSPESGIEMTPRFADEPRPESPKESAETETPPENSNTQNIFDNLPESQDTVINCKGCMPQNCYRSVEIPLDPPKNFFPNPEPPQTFLPGFETPLGPPRWDSPRSVNITITTPNRSGNLMCPRHGAPIQEGIAFPKFIKDGVEGGIIRRILPSGDFEEEELHHGVRIICCAVCGTKETTYRDRIGYRRINTPQGHTKEEFPDGYKETRYKNGNILKEYPNGDKILNMPNGDRKITRCGLEIGETASGYVKIIFPDGREETRCPDGRVRKKDPNKKVILDTYMPVVKKWWEDPSLFATVQ